jgi:hypothetical protein
MRSTRLVSGDPGRVTEALKASKPSTVVMFMVNASIATSGLMAPGGGG